MTGYLVDFQCVIWSNRKTSASGLSMKFGSAAIGDQLNFKPKLDGFVMNGHQFFFAVATDAYFGKRSQDPRLLVWGKVV
jgi:hypothetical protein